MVKVIRKSFMMLLVMTLVTGIIYPLGITGLAQVFFPRTANGTLLSNQGETVGSALIGQNYTDAKYFHGRPSAAGEGYDAAASSGSNLGPTNQVLLQSVADRADQIRKENNLARDTAIPADLVTASASGLDPNISPEAAMLQVPRVARERNLDEARVQDLVRQYTEGRQFGILGEPRVNLLKLNRILDNL
jgi:K+-transporting ATPase, C subunit